jgi:hypothetical protein
MIRTGASVFGGLVGGGVLDGGAVPSAQYRAAGGFGEVRNARGGVRHVGGDLRCGEGTRRPAGVRAVGAAPLAPRAVGVSDAGRLAPGLVVERRIGEEPVAAFVARLCDDVSRNQF